MRTLALTLAALAFGAIAPMLHAGQAGSPDVTVQVADADAAQAQALQDEALQKQQQAIKEREKALREAERAIREQERVIRIMASDKPRIGIIVETEADEDSGERLVSSAAGASAAEAQAARNRTAQSAGSRGRWSACNDGFPRE